MRLKFNLLILILLIIGGCKKDKEEPDPGSGYPPQPYLEFKQLKLSGDTLFITNSYRDGDGNFGLDVSDTLPPFNPASGNYFFYFHRKINGVFNHDPRLDLNYRITRITGNNIQPGVTLKSYFFTACIRTKWEGEIIVPVYSYKPYLNGDTFLIKMQIADRSLNLSDTIVTPEFVVK